MILKFKVVGQTLLPQPTNRLPRRGSREYLQLDFEFDECWEDHTKTIYFSSGGYSTAVVYSGDPIQVGDYWANLDGFLLSVGLILDEQSVMTNDISVSLDPSSTVWLTLPPTTDIPAYQQLVNLAQQAAASAQQAEASVQDGTQALTIVNRILNGEGNIAVSSATANMLSLPHGKNGVVIYADTQDAVVPVVCFEGERGDEPTILRCIATPQQFYDAATKGYVDGSITAALNSVVNVEEVAF